MTLLADMGPDILACASPVKITRFLPVAMNKGRKTGSNVQRTFTVDLVMWPLTDKELQRLPEGQRGEGLQGFISPERLDTVRTSECKTADHIENNGTTYQVSTIKDWSTLGNFFEGVATRLDR